MYSHIRRLIVGVLLVTGLIANGIPFVSILPKTEAAFHTVSTEEIQLPYESEPLSSKDPFTSYMVGWEGPIDLHMYARTNINSEWSEWEEIYIDVDMVDAEISTKYYSQVQFTQPATALQLRFEGHEDESIERLEIVTLGEKDTVSLSFLRPTANAMIDGFVVSRSEWGADTNYLYADGWNVARDKVCKEQPWYCTTSPAAEKATAEKAKKQQELFPEDTKVASRSSTLDGKELAWSVSKSAKINKLFVHHTANVNKDQNGDGVMNRADEEIALRSVYYFHSVVRGWGDIGYNYLIGPSGTVYEGRAGGDFAVGAHAVWRNISSVGVSLMGNFEQEKLGQNQKTALGNTLGYLSKKYNLDPTGKTTFYGKETETILGHRDSDEAATACPGVHVYQDLNSIRTLAQNAKNGAPGTVASNDPLIKSPGFSASMQPFESAIVFEPMTSKTIPIRITNTGTETWDRSTYITVSSPASGLYTVVSGDKTEKKAATARDSIVPAGDTTIFDLTLLSGIQEFTGNLTVSVVAGGKYQMEAFGLPVQFKKGIVSYSDGAITVADKQYLYGEPVSVSVTAKNTGSLPWNKNGDNRFYFELLMQQPNGTISTLLPEISPVQNMTAPGASTIFSGTFDAPFISGNTQLIVVARMKGYPDLIGVPVRKAITVTHPGNSGRFTVGTDSSVTSNSIKMGETGLVRVKVKNASATIWEYLSKYPLTVELKDGGTYSVQDEATFATDKIAPGGEGEISFLMQSGYVPGTRELSARFLLAGTPLFDKELRFSVTTPQETLTAQFETSTVSFAENTANQTITIRAKNTGTIPWKEGSVYIYPESADNIRWGFNNTVVTFADKRTIAPGETATFTLTAPSLAMGIYPSKFGLRIQNGPQLQISNPDISLTVTQAAKRFIPGNGLEFGTYLHQRTPTLSGVISASTPKSSGTISSTSTVVPAVSTQIQTAPTNLKVKLSYSQPQSTIKALQSDYIIKTGEGIATKLPKDTEVSIIYTDGVFSVQSGTTTLSSAKIEFSPVQSDARFQIVGWTRGTEPSTMYDNEFRGSLVLESKNSDIHYINALSFNDYMKGLAEVPKSDPVEKQKAIILVARTYAYFYLDPKNKRDSSNLSYDMTDNPDEYQRYRGYKYELRHPEWANYLNATQDEVVTYKGRLIKTPFFSESDGRTRSAQEVWGWTDTPYLQSKSDISCKEGEGTLKGHGVGLSGCGSAGLALQGKTYKDIINYYYTGVEVKKIGEL